MAFDWGPLFQAGLQGALNFGTQYYQGEQQKDQYQQKLKDEKDLLTFKAGLAGEGGGGGGAAGPFTGFTDPQKVTAIQNQNAQSMQAIDAIIKAYQTALLGGR